MSYFPFVFSFVRMMVSCEQTKTRLAVYLRQHPLLCQIPSLKLGGSMTPWYRNLGRIHCHILIGFGHRYETGSMTGSMSVLNHQLCTAGIES